VTKRKATEWSHSDGDAPWSQNYRAPTVPDIAKDPLASLMDARSAKADKRREYEPDERIRGQFE
jgi:hypothetical protein